MDGVVDRSKEKVTPSHVDWRSWHFTLVDNVRDDREVFSKLVALEARHEHVVGG